MPRLSRTPSASSQSYTYIPLSPRLGIRAQQDGNQYNDMPYYHPHHARVSSLNGGYYDQNLEASLPSPGGATAVSMPGQAAYNQDPFAVGPPLTMAGGSGNTSAMTSTTAVGGSGAVRASNGGGSRSSFSVQHPRTSSGAWSPQDDEALIRARARGENWARIQQQFPGKTPNACRKRHERLMERRNADDFDTRKMEHIAREYMIMRKEIWTPLAQRTGEKWTTVEQKCMASGLKNLQGVSRAAARRERLEAGYAVAGGYHDDELDALDHNNLSPGALGDDLEGGGSSPGSGVGLGSAGGGSRSVSGGSNSSTVSLSLQPTTATHMPPPSAAQQHHYQQHSRRHSHQPQYATAPHHLQVPPSTAGGPHHHHPAEAVSPTGAYPEYYTAAGFSQSLRNMDSLHPSQAQVAAAMAGGAQYIGGGHHAAGANSRVNAAVAQDMGIDSLLGRGAASRNSLQ